MALINVSLRHGRTLEDARASLQEAVRQATSQYGPMIQRIEWSPDRTQVQLHGTGFQVEIRVDAADVHASGDVFLLGGLLNLPLAAGLKQIVHNSFKQLPR